MYRRIFFGMAALLFCSLITIKQASAQVCPPGEVDLSAAIAYGSSWIGKNYAFGGGHPGPGPNVDNGALGCYPGGPATIYPNCKPGVPSYDCSGLAGAVASQIAGYTGGLGIATTLMKRSTTPAVAGTNPVFFSFSRLGEHGPGTAGHVWITICGKRFNSANYIDGIAAADSPGPLIRRIPRGLEGLTMASCNSTCTPGCTPATCPNVIGGDGLGESCQKFVAYLNKWWDDEFFPALKDMTAQLYSYRIFETWELGRMMDAQNINRTARVVQEQRLSSTLNELPNEAVCVAGSYPSALSQAAMNANALTQGFKKDLTRRGNNVTIAGEPDANPASDQKKRWEEYCKEFHDPTSNNGVSACPSPGTPGLVMNADITIEGFLLKDTINMSNPDEYTATQALLRNLVQPLIVPRIPEATVSTITGQDYIIKQQHLESLNNIARDVVASIISRRSSISPTTPSPIGPMIKDIRTKAGVDPALIANNPSYNEIMQALTKERFFDIEYFTRMHNNLGAIKQEQTSVDAYITVQMQDIYRLQEQINALLAARAALKLESDKNSSMINSAPVR